MDRGHGVGCAHAAGEVSALRLANERLALGYVEQLAADEFFSHRWRVDARKGMESSRIIGAFARQVPAEFLNGLPSPPRLLIL